MHVSKSKPRRKPAARKRSRAAIGVFNLDEAQKAATHTLQDWINHGLLNTKNAEQFAAANQQAQKSIEKLAEAAAIAGAPLEGLKRLEIEAGSVRTQLDQFAVTSMTPITASLADISL
jgi:hypothetical protein